MSVVIDNITYNIDDEDLDEIEYLEILTMQEIIKDNPNFIAFSREEIFNEAYDFFKNSNKADGFADMFFKDKTQSIKNFVFATNAQKKVYECMEENIQEYVNDMNRLSQLPYDVSQKEKNKYYFALTYDDNKQIRLKPNMKTTLKLETNNIESDTYYPIYGDDDTNVPIIGAYYKRFGSSLVDKLSHKIVENLQKPALINYADSDGYTDVEKLIKAVKPKMNTILEQLDLKEYESYDLDYNDLEGFLMRFDMSLDDVNLKDYEQLRVHLESILDEKPQEVKYGKYKIKETIIHNSKFDFFNRINADKKHNIVQLLNITDKMKEDYTMLIENLQEEKMNINAPPLLYDNINDMVRAVSNNDVALEDIIENLRANRDVLIINHAINTMKGLKENDVESIGGMLDHLTETFELLRGAIKPGFKFQFLNFYEDIKEVKEANDYSQYEGIPDIYKNNGNYEGGGEANEGFGEEVDYDDGQIAAIGELNANNLEKYWLSIKFSNAAGFTEMLKTVLQVIDAVKKDAKLPLNFDRLCDELFKHFSGIPSKYDLMEGILNKADIKLADDFVRDLTKISPVVAMNNVQSSALMSADIVGYVQTCNSQYCDILYDMLSVAMSWWCLQIQDDIINQTLAFDENSLQIRYYDLWSLNGLPMKESKQGVLVYLSAILGDVLEETGYQFLIKDGNLLNKLVKTIGNEYQDVVNVLREQSKNVENKRMIKGKETYEALVDTFKKKDKTSLLNNYIDALIYYPSYKYKQLHKFLLGCCLQQIGKDFEAYNDMTDRKDLQAGKKQLSKKQLQKRYSLYLPVKQVEEDASDEENEETYLFETPQMPEEESTSDDIIVSILKEMIEVENSLLPEIHINNFIKSTKPALALSKQYVQLFCKTAGYKPNELQAYFDNNDVNFRGILLMLCSVYYKYETNDNIERGLLLKAVSTIKDILKHWTSLVKYANEYNIADIRNLQLFVIARSLCLPSNPDISKNILQLSVKTSNAFMTDLMKVVYMSVMKHMRSYNMPDEETNTKFINSIREQNKIKQLNLMNTKTIDERGIMQAIKKLGLKYQDENEANDEQYNINDDYANEFEKDDEVVLKDQEEYGDEEIDDYGFIYS